MASWHATSGSSAGTSSLTGIGAPHPPAATTPEQVDAVYTSTLPAFSNGAKKLLQLVLVASFHDKDTFLGRMHMPDNESRHDHLLLFFAAL
jgi:hypothetical protein